MDEPFERNARFAEATPHDFAGRHDDHERMRVDSMGNQFDFADLREFDDDKDDIAFLARKGTLSMQERHAAADFHDAISNLLGLVRDNQHGLAAVETGDDLIRDHRVHIHADERKHCRRHTEKKGCHAHNHAVEAEDDAAHVERIIFLGNRTDDIKAARTAVHAKDDAVANAVENAAEDGREHNVIDRRVGIEKTREVKACGIL